MKKIPRVLLWGTLLPCAWLAYCYFFSNMAHAEMLKAIYQTFGILFSIWFFIGTVTIGCVVVMLMKGPAYVADPYPLPEEDQSLEEFK